VHRGSGVVIGRAEVDQHAPCDGSELAGLVGVVDHGRSGADGEQDVGGPPRHDDVGQALDQGGPVAQRGQGIAQVLRGHGRSRTHGADVPSLVRARSGSTGVFSAVARFLSSSTPRHGRL